MPPKKSGAPPSSTKRLHKELNDLSNSSIEGILFDPDKISTNLHKWKIGLRGAPETLYSGERFELDFTFGSNYPFESPQVGCEHLAVPVSLWAHRKASPAKGTNFFSSKYDNRRQTFNLPKSSFGTLPVEEVGLRTLSQNTDIRLAQNVNTNDE